MRRHLLTFGAIVISGAMLPAAIGFGPAKAFTETAIQQSGQQAPLAPTTPDSGKGVGLNADVGGKSMGAPALGLSDPAAAAGKSLEGTEVKIPGIGTVGTLPKLDFGLELLYGANGEGTAQEKALPSNDDVLIKGTLKHRF
jgi:hypothetical protein